MKIIFSILILINLPVMSFAQLAYVPFPEGEAVWHVGYKESVGVGSYQDQYSYSGDTIFNGFEYMKLSKKSECKCPLYSLVDYGIIGFIRQDTMLRKVYYYTKNDSSEYLLFDFNLQVGDLYPHTYTYQQNDLKVTRIDSILTGNIYRKEFVLNQVGANDTIRLIEGIGIDMGLLTAADWYCFENCRWLSCFQENGETVYTQQVWSIGPLCNMTGAEEVDGGIFEINLQPNLVKQGESVRVNFNLAFQGDVILLDLYGQIIYQADVLSQSFIIIETSFLAKGMYVLIGGALNGISRNLKLLVQ